MSFKQIILFAILLMGFAHSQTWGIITIEDRSINLDNLSIIQNDTLIGIVFGDVIEIPIQNILSIRYKNINVDKGILGGCLGWATGAVLGMSLSSNYETGGNAGVIVGTIVGYLIFSKSFGAKYKLNNMTLEQKVDTINKLIEKYEK